jgi:malate dehydrogenase (oxaloacetate-decarboxylating)(NADP+)
MSQNSQFTSVSNHNQKPNRRGIDLVRDPLWNKGTAFSEAERDALGLRGLLSPRYDTIEQQEMRVMSSLALRESDFDKYIYLMQLRERNETLFFKVLIDNLEALMPIVYTPVVGRGCQEFGRVLRRPPGLFVSRREKGKIKEVLQNWPEKDVRCIVVTDGERILGLGDLGANGMGIPVGKLALYTACAGVHPLQCLPITIDAGTNNENLLEDPLYIGEPVQRLHGASYDALIDEFVHAVKEVWPRALLQWEDFGNSNAFRFLHHYSDTLLSFNDDIQGTAGVTLAGIYSALRITGKPLTEQTFLFMGAGEAGIGCGDLIVSALMAEGMSETAARQRCWFVDSKGLVVSGRTDLAEHKLPYAHAHNPINDFMSALLELRPSAIIGLSGSGKFTKPMVEAMSEFNEHPIIFSLSNPTSKSECTAEEAYAWSDGAGIFASGSPFMPVDYKGKTYVPGQGNNSYVFPGVGLGVIVSEASKVTDEMFFVAARTLAGLVTENDLALGRIYPALNRIREISAEIATAVCEVVYERGLTSKPRPTDIAADVKAHMYEPTYMNYV